MGIALIATKPPLLETAFSNKYTVDNGRIQLSSTDPVQLITQSSDATHQAYNAHSHFKRVSSRHLWRAAAALI